MGKKAKEKPAFFGDVEKIQREHVKTSFWGIAAAAAVILVVVLIVELGWV